MIDIISLEVCDRILIFRDEIDHDCRQVAVDEIIVDNIDEVEGVVYFLQECMRGAVCLIDVCPLIDPGRKCFVLPESECFLVNNSGLDNLVVLEYTPGHGVDVSVIFVDVLHLLA